MVKSGNSCGCFFLGDFAKQIVCVTQKLVVVSIEVRNVIKDCG